MNKHIEEKHLEFSKKVMEIARMADKGDDKGYGHALAQLVSYFGDSLTSIYQRGQETNPIEHCGEIDCPECNKKAYDAGYQRGREDERNEAKNKTFKDSVNAMLEIIENNSDNLLKFPRHVPSAKYGVSWNIEMEWKEVAKRHMNQIKTSLRNLLNQV